jgi:hypothetical protein
MQPIAKITGGVGCALGEKEYGAHFHKSCVGVSGGVLLVEGIQGIELRLKVPTGGAGFDAENIHSGLREALANFTAKGIEDEHHLLRVKAGRDVVVPNVEDNGARLGTEDDFLAVVPKIIKDASTKSTGDNGERRHVLLKCFVPVADAGRTSGDDFAGEHGGCYLIVEKFVNSLGPAIRILEGDTELGSRRKRQGIPLSPHERGKEHHGKKDEEKLLHHCDASSVLKSSCCTL